jgi:S-formylglutathione hydrolase
VQYGIYLPKAYDAAEQAATKWPLVIWLHGMHEDHLRFHVRGGAPVLDAAVKDGKLPPCVFVCPNGGRTSMYVNRKDQRWEDLISVDLLAHLTKTYRVSESRDQRAILGVSMGGMGALRIAFTQPELFCCVGTHSAAVFPEDPAQLPERLKQYAHQLGLDEVFGNPIQKEPWQKANPLCLAIALEPKQLKGLRIYFDAGSEDRYGFADGNELLHEALDKRGIEHTFRMIQGGGHSWGANFQDETLPYSFAMVGEAFMVAAAKKAGLEGLQGPGGGKGDGKGEAGPGR